MNVLYIGGDDDDQFVYERLLCIYIYTDTHVDKTHTITN